MGWALLALPFRANIPVAAAMTFLSNPATTPLILMASVWLGNWMLGRSADASGFMALVDRHARTRQEIGAHPNAVRLISEELRLDIDVLLHDIARWFATHNEAYGDPPRR